MLKIILKAPHQFMPFCEPARDLRIQNTPLWLWQRKLLAPYVTGRWNSRQGAALP